MFEEGTREYGDYVTMVFQSNNDIRCYATKYYYEDYGSLRADMLNQGSEYAIMEVFEDLIEQKVCTLLYPDEIGALTNCPLIIGENPERDEEGKLINIGRVWWHAEYAVEDWMDMLLVDKLILVGGE